MIAANRHLLGQERFSVHENNFSHYETPDIHNYGCIFIWAAARPLA